jgi:S-adenosyl-L-methionine hydrolase (adenosine-forming)
MSGAIIALTTDFGLADGYVGTMKGVILGICPKASLVDICHDIRPQAVRQAAYVLRAAAPYFPPGTVHLVVVDPGVGGARRPVVVQTARTTYVAPDNGVLAEALSQDPAHLAIHLTDPRYHLPQVSATFQGRDLFAPAAAHLACGTDPRNLGEEISAASLVSLPRLTLEHRADGAWLGEVLHVDRFGNLVTSVRWPFPDGRPTSAGRPLAILVGGARIEGLSRTFSDVAPGDLVAYVGSSGHLEVAIREGKAAARLGVDVGDPVVIESAVQEGEGRGG